MNSLARLVHPLACQQAARTKTALLAPAALALLLSACASPVNVRINPTRMHVSENRPLATLSKSGDISVSAESVSNAEKLPAQRYFLALQRASEDNASLTTQQRQARIDELVSTGVTVTQAYCLRWFQRMSDQGLIKDYADGNINVLRQLGTAFLGIGGASSSIVSTYGAANTAWEGLSKNFEDSFLLAPTSRKVKAQIMGMLDREAKVLLSSDKPESFDQAYIRLERYADLCTHTSAREVVNNALDQGKAVLDEGGRIRVDPSDEGTRKAIAEATQNLLLEKKTLGQELDQVKLERNALRASADLVKGLQQQVEALIQAQKSLQEQLRAQAAPALAPAPAASSPG